MLQILRSVSSFDQTQVPQQKCDTENNVAALHRLSRINSFIEEFLDFPGRGRIHTALLPLITHVFAPVAMIEAFERVEFGDDAEVLGKMEQLLVRLTVEVSVSECLDLDKRQKTFNCDTLIKYSTKAEF
jgi:hypothetical protein